MNRKAWGGSRPALGDAQKPRRPDAGEALGKTTGFAQTPLSPPGEFYPNGTPRADASESSRDEPLAVPGGRSSTPTGTSSIKATEDRQHGSPLRRLGRGAGGSGDWAHSSGCDPARVRVPLQMLRNSRWALSGGTFRNDADVGPSYRGR